MCFGIGGVFSLIGIGGTVVMLRAGDIAFEFALGWTAAAALLFYIGWRYRRAGAREKSLRANGIHGRATVSSFKETRIVVDGNPRVDLVLHVELPNRAPYDVKTSDYVPDAAKLVTEGTDLPVFVSQSNANDVLVDWWND